MTALILATKAHLSFFGSCVADFRSGVLSVAAWLDETARERIALVVLCAAALLVCLYIVSVNVILGEGGRIGILERVFRNETIILLDAETAFAVQSSVEQLKKYDVVRSMEDTGRIEYMRMNSPSLVEASHLLP